MHNHVYKVLAESLSEVLPAERIISDPLRTLAYGTDASFYRLNPQLVLKVENEAEVQRIIELAQQHQTPLTFRAAGTSLSGQAITDSVLVVLASNAWQDFEIHNQGSAITVQPGLIGAQVNARLAPYGRKIGPDPASINAAKIGGIAANNASGMCCGTAQNSYHTLAGMRILFADGSLLDTRDADSVSAFQESHAELLAGLKQLSNEAKADDEVRQLIEHKYRLKNTTGYSLNALLDYCDPVDILQHLLIGSEGTLGFISSITYNTVADPKCKATALVLFPDIESSCASVPALAASDAVTAVELMDRPALRSVEDKPGIPPELKQLGPEASALLIDVRAEDTAALQQYVDAVQAVLGEQQLLAPVEFTSDPEEYARLWNIRKGLFPAVGAVRPLSTTVIIEDVAFPLPQLAAGVRDLHALLRKYGYHEAIIFGHALDGNVHFVFTQDFSNDAEVERYRQFMDEVCVLVATEYKGSLKAEHGTGRNMAPFVEMEWGATAYGFMQRLKRLFDPENLLNPGVILNQHKDAHVRDLKPLPAAHELVDRCIECGFCEPICPSRTLTLTPRQRITVWREISRLERDGSDPERLKRLQKDYAYQGLDTCAADGLCATLCPVGIDTGSLVKDLRHQQHSSFANSVANWTERHFAAMVSGTRLGLGAASLAQNMLGNSILLGLNKGMRTITADAIPQWLPSMPSACKAPKVPEASAEQPKIVYFSACVCRAMGSSKDHNGDQPLSEVVLSLLEKAGFGVVLPAQQDSLCCGQPYESKGFPEAADNAVQRLKAALWEASEQGQLPILCDTSPCSMRMKEQIGEDLQIFELTEFMQQYLIPRLQQTQRVPSIALHVTCSSRKMGLAPVLQAVAEQCAEQVHIPEQQGCCGFAGDRGFSYPELNAAALQALRAGLPTDCEQGYSNSRSCEIGLSHHAGIPYRSLAYLVNECFDKAK